MRFQNIKFIKTVVCKGELPSLQNLPEITVIGRSNVGKSSLLNHLFSSKALVKTSSTPGKTRALNFFNVDHRFICVDMPGYGYAAVSKGEAKQWAGLIEHYLMHRETLKLLLFLVDIRHLPSKEDLQMFSWIEHHNLPVLFVFTKVDKVSKAEKETQTQIIRDEFYKHSLKKELFYKSSCNGSTKDFPHVHYSTIKNEGRKELIAILKRALFDEIY